MKKNILICLAIVFTLLFTGCAPKQDDNLAVKTLKHASMTPVYAGKVVNGALMMAIGMPIVLAKKALQGDLHEIQDVALNKYEYKKRYKAFAIAIDSKETFVYQYGWQHQTQEEANAKVLKDCEKRRVGTKVKNTCVLYYIGEEKQFELSSKVALTPTEDKKEETSIESENQTVNDKV